VALYEDRAAPKVIDFGVAKAAGQTLTDKTLMTPEALTVHRKGLAVWRELAAAPGANLETRLDVAHSQRTVGRLRIKTGDPADMWAKLKRPRTAKAVRGLLIHTDLHCKTGGYQSG